MNGKLSQLKTGNSAPESSEGRTGNDRSAGYTSSLMAARRDRILSVARDIIASGSITTLNMDDVSRRAGVAKGTLYNAFQNKERLIAAAIQQYFDEYESRIIYFSENESIDRVLERFVVVARRNIKIRNYIHALMNVYFSDDVDPDIYKAIHKIGTDSQDSLLNRMAKKRQIHRWIDLPMLGDQLVRLRYALAHAWAKGLIANDRYPIEIARTFFTHLAGASCGAGYRDIIALLKGLDENAIFANHF